MGIENLGHMHTICYYDEFVGDVLNIIPLHKNFKHILFNSDICKEFMNERYDSKYDILPKMISFDHFLRYDMTRREDIPSPYYTFKYNFKPTDIRINNRMISDHVYGMTLMNTGTNKNKRSYLL